MGEPSSRAKTKAFMALSRHSECLKEGAVLNDLIDDLAREIDEARDGGMTDVSRTWFTDKDSRR